MTGLVDTHAHLTMPGLREDIPGVLHRAAQAGVTQVITVATDLADAQQVVVSAEAHEQVWAVVGIHPHEAGKVTADAAARLCELATHPKVVGLGEMGLDYYYDFSDRASQAAVFRMQLALAGDLDLPLVIHCREAIDDAIHLLHEHGFDGRPVVFHCFTGTAEEARRLADHGWHLSFTGIVTFRKSESLQAIARHYPADQLMVETDAPYLSPEPVRKQRPNEPAFVRHTAEFLARLRDEPLAGLAERTGQNARRFFRLPTPS